jgi:uncharacterized protein YdcH (DUF465 family)
MWLGVEISASTVSNLRSEFRNLMEVHNSTDSRLGDLQKKPSLSAKETLEEVELKKIKLRAKERIYHIVQEASKRAEQ